ncbi:DUF697 domain-containing protein [Vicingaceae bacterium]|nr:DUF697 domain-containing protein [Vicingaceae bacterium]
MKIRETITGFGLLVVAACAGLALIYLPNWVIDNYQTVSGFSSFWGAAYLIVVGSGIVILLGCTGWIVWRLYGNRIAKNRRRERRSKNPSELSKEQKSREIEENLGTIDQLASESPLESQLQSELDPLVRDLNIKREAQTLEIVAFGNISSGKSSVLNLLAGRDVFATDARGGTTVTRNEIPWPGMDRVTLVDTPGLGEIDGSVHVAIAAEAAKDADLVLVVVDGPLRDSEHQLLEKLGQMEKRTIICLNKSDWYTPTDQEKLAGQLGDQTTGFVRREDIVVIQSDAGHRIRKRIMPDGSEVEETVTTEPLIDPLADRMIKVLKKEGKDLLMANVLLQSRGLVEKAKLRVKESIDRKAWKVVDKYMWGAGGVAAVSPWPIVDIAAGCGISTKMILELADVYHQQVDMDMATKWLGEMGKNLVGVLGATAATTAVVSIIGSLLKTVPVAGTIAGGILQGATQALITKWIGFVFVEYFRNEMQAPEGGLAGLARRQWEVVTSADELRRLVKAARQKLSGAA